ncbi:MAG: hypothetical protein Q8Q02_05095 [Nocardioides sp.]|nr:hypothetical protein [Nocardioides sp.]
MSPLPRLRQPDPTTCGPACLVFAALLRDPAHGGVLAAPDPQRAFAAIVLDLHPRVRRVWPQRYGATPWAVARAMREVTGTPHSVRWVRGRRGRRTSWASLSATVAAGEPMVVFVGSRFLPRHVVLAHVTDGARVGAYEPGSGRTVTATAEHLLAGRPPWGFPVPWALVTPRPTRRTRA